MLIGKLYVSLGGFEFLISCTWAVAFLISNEEICEFLYDMFLLIHSLMLKKSSQIVMFDKKRLEDTKV